MKAFIILAFCLLSSGIAFSAERISIDFSDVQVQQHLSYNFGRVWVNSMNRVIYNIRNTGTLVLEREGFSIGGHGYDAYTNCPKVLPPGAQCELEIRYWPSFEGMHSGRMYMFFTDKNDLVIDLFGEAYRM